MRVICALALLLAAGALFAGSEQKEARRLYDQARKAERTGRIVEAYLLYSQAVARDPQNLEFWGRAQSLRVRANLLSRERLLQSGLTPAGEAPARAAETLEPPPLPDVLPPPELKPSGERRNLDLRGDPRTLFTLIARLYRLEALFDPEYPPAAPLSIRLDDANWRDAIRVLEAATGSFVIPTGERQFLVVKDTPQKRAGMEPFVWLTVPVPASVTAADTQELVAILRQVMGINRAGFDPQRRNIYIRDRMSLALPAQQLLLELLRQKAVVALEVELLEVDRSVADRFGMALQNAASLVAFGRPWRSPISIPAGFARFMVFGGGGSLLGFGVAGAQLVAMTSRSVGSTLFRTELRSLEGQPASIHIGERFPIVTAKEILANPADAPSLPPSFNFEDLGLAIKATPRVHGVEEMTLTLETTFKALTGEFVDEIPVLANRVYTTEVRVRSGEWTVIAGLMSASEARTISGLAGIARIPVVGPLLSQNTRDRSDRQVLLLIRPRLLSLPAGETPTRPLPTGSEARPRIPL
jgi:hypothetical protein